MCSVSPTAASRHSRSAASATRFAELVKKTGTSATLSAKKRRTKARKRLLRATQEHRRHAKFAGLRAVALTLTFADNGKFCAKLISKFIACVRQAMKRLGHRLPYSWVLESEGRLHYHLMFWLPRSFILDKEKLAQWWPWGTTWTAGCRLIKGWARYMAKFDCMARLPKGVRLFGYGGLDEGGKAAVQRACLPRWLQALLPRGECVRRFQGGWANSETGELYVSPYLWTPWGWMTRLYVPVKSDGPRNETA
ncbi:hypothetical protein NUV26_32930 [Burkholderia pseudomultivorans]|uniref:rolling circle replication-associated protein n=1 Tax=Burkholderia pseudomultivorans TaxID=1207504 RepID=UPI002875A35D|nr:hypothetical protein [Burkholderia pseudomultivorans]MDS0796972.1 hypothetical protein [Burkholderia pseudomultivorans]